MYGRGFTELLSPVVIFNNLHMHAILTQMIKTAPKPQHMKKLKKENCDHPPRKFSSHNVFIEKKKKQTIHALGLNKELLANMASGTTDKNSRNMS